MNTTGIRLVIDTNVFITIIGRKSPNRWIFDKIISGELLLCVSNDIILEYEELLAEKTNKEVSRNVTDFLLISHLLSSRIYFLTGISFLKIRMMTNLSIVILLQTQCILFRTINTSQKSGKLTFQRLNSFL